MSFNMKVRPIDLNKDAGDLVEWWESYKWTPPTVEMLPQEGGIMVLTEEDQPVLAGFVIETNTSIWFLEWIIGNPKFKEERREAMAYLISTAKERTKGKAKVLMTMATNKGWIKGATENGFQITDQGVTHMLIGVN